MFSSSDGPLTAASIDLLQSTWGKAKQLGPDVVGEKLFERILADPQLEPMFPFKDDKEQLSAHAIGVVLKVDYAVSNLNNLEKVVPALQELGKKHVGYGV